MLYHTRHQFRVYNHFIKKDIPRGLSLFLITPCPVDLPRTDCISLFSAEIDRLTASETLNMMRFHFSTLGLILEVFNALCLVASKFGANRISNWLVVIILGRDGFPTTTEMVIYDKWETEKINMRFGLGFPCRRWLFSCRRWIPI